MKILTIGTFDIPHFGHYSFLKKISAVFDFDDKELVIAVNSDEFVEKFKGKRPVFTQGERMELMAKVDWATVVRNTGDENVEALIRTVKPNVIAIGSDWARKNYLNQLGIDQDFLDRMDISLIYIPYTSIISTTEIKKRLQ